MPKKTEEEIQQAINALWLACRSSDAALQKQLCLLLKDVVDYPEQVKAILESVNPEAEEYFFVHNVAYNRPESLPMLLSIIKQYRKDDNSFADILLMTSSGCNSNLLMVAIHHFVPVGKERKIVVGYILDTIDHLSDESVRGQLLREVHIQKPIYGSNALGLAIYAESFIFSIGSGLTLRMLASIEQLPHEEQKLVFKGISSKNGSKAYWDWCSDKLVQLVFASILKLPKKDVADVIQHYDHPLLNKLYNKHNSVFNSNLTAFKPAESAAAKEVKSTMDEPIQMRWITNDML